MAKLKIRSLKRVTRRLEIRPLQLRDDRAWMASNCAMLPTRSPWEIPRVPLSQLNFNEFAKVLEEHKSEIEADKKYTLGIFHKEVGTLLGYLYVKDISRQKPSRATIDFRLINIYWGNGFAKESVAEGLKLKTTLKIDHLVVDPKSSAKLKL